MSLHSRLSRLERRAAWPVDLAALSTAELDAMIGTGPDADLVRQMTDDELKQVIDARSDGQIQRVIERAKHRILEE